MSRSDMSRCSKCSCIPDVSEINSVGDIPVIIDETKDNCKKEIKKELKKKVGKKIKKKKGSIMKFLIKLIAKLIFKAAILAGFMAGVLFILNKFAPEVFDTAYNWFVDLRDKKEITEKDED